MSPIGKYCCKKFFNLPSNTRAINSMLWCRSTPAWLKAHSSIQPPGIFLRSSSSSAEVIRDEQPAHQFEILAHKPYRAVEIVHPQCEFCLNVMGFAFLSAISSCEPPELLRGTEPGIGLGNEIDSYRLSDWNPVIAHSDTRARSQSH